MKHSAWVWHGNTCEWDSVCAARGQSHMAQCCSFIIVSVVPTTRRSGIAPQIHMWFRDSSLVPGCTARELSPPTQHSVQGHEELSQWVPHRQDPPKQHLSSSCCIRSIKCHLQRRWGRPGAPRKGAEKLWGEGGAQSPTNSLAYLSHCSRPGWAPLDSRINQMSYDVSPPMVPFPGTRGTCWVVLLGRKGCSRTFVGQAWNPLQHMLAVWPRANSLTSLDLHVLICTIPSCWCGGEKDQNRVRILEIMVGYVHLLQNKSKKGAKQMITYWELMCQTWLCRHCPIHAVRSISPEMKSELRKVTNYFKS